MDCAEIREQLPLLLYGDAERESEIRAHLAQCGACTAALDELSRSRSALSAWAPIEDPADVSTIAAATAAYDAHRAAARRRPLLHSLYGVAAGILAFAVASAVGTTIEHGDGSLRITFGRAAAPLPADAAALREVVANEVGERFAATLTQFADLANGWNAAQQERYGDVLRVMQQESERQRARESQRTQDLMDGLIQVAAYPPRPHRP